MGEEIIHAGFTRNSGSRKWIVPRDHHRADSHCPQLIETIANSALDDIFQFDHAERATSPFCDNKGRSPGAGNFFYGEFD